MGAMNALDQQQSQPVCHSLESSTGGSSRPRSVFIKTYGCQMNVSDSELVTSILLEKGYTIASTDTAADVVLLNTCAIRDKAEAKIWGKLQLLKHEGKGKGHKQMVGLLGCMAGRLKDKLLTSGLVDVIAGALRLIPCVRAVRRSMRQDGASF